MLARMTALRVNVGCGQTPTPGWLNFDNSPAVRLGRLPAAARILHRLRLLDDNQLAFASFCARHEIAYANALRLPLARGSVAVLYSSHMLEHFDRDTASAFLREARRVLVPGGMLRFAIPDLRLHIRVYNKDQDADKLIAGMLVCAPAPRGLLSRAKLAIQGPRHHLWMYDARSLSSLLECHGFVDVTELPAGRTRIANPGKLDLRERNEESLYVEAISP
jgi:SAM-dependent methyltransferase